MATKKDVRTRNWTFIQYDESAPENWRDLLDQLHVPWVESPLHDKDVNPDGEAKKSHRHIGLAFSGKKSFEQVKEISDMISGVKPEPIANMKGFVRYLIHKDNPEKFQYEINDIVPHSGFDVFSHFDVTGREKRQVLQEMIQYIRDNQIDSFAEFSDYCFTEKFDEWVEVLIDKNTLFIKEYIRSYAWKHKVIDSESGEVRYEGNFLRGDAIK